MRQLRSCYCQRPQDKLIPLDSFIPYCIHYKSNLHNGPQQMHHGERSPLPMAPYILVYRSDIGMSSSLCVCDREPSGCWRAQSADGAAGAGVYGRPDASNAGGAWIHGACLPPFKC